MTDLARLRRIAEAATPGPWTTNGTAIAAAGVTLCEGEEGDWNKADAAHIATFDPPTVLALLDVVEAASDPAVFDIFSDTTMYPAQKKLAAALSRLESHAD